MLVALTDMANKPVLCPNCARPMREARTLPHIAGEPDDHVFECRQCEVSFVTEDHLPIYGARER